MDQSLHGVMADNRAKIREILVRHYDLQQSKNKAQAALVTILFLTQITELKMLIDTGREVQAFYDFVHALLVTSLALLIVIGVMIIYIGNLRLTPPRTAQGGLWARITHCLFCCCHPRCTCAPQRPARRAVSYVNVPIGVGTESMGHARGNGDVHMASPVTSHSSYGDEDDEEVVGCFEFAVPRAKFEKTNDVERVDSSQSVESSRLRHANSMVRIVRAANLVEELKETLNKPGKRNEHNHSSPHYHEHCPRCDLDDQYRHAKDELEKAKKEKSETEVQQLLAEQEMQHVALSKEHWEEKEEKTVHRKVQFWQQLANYLLYFVMLMNVFVTAFGISGRGKK